MGRPRGIRAVLFDKDGTLLDYARTWVPINRDIATFAARGDVALATTLLEIGGQDPVTGAVRPGSPLAAGTHDEIADTFSRHLGTETPPGLAAAIARIFTEGGARHAVLVDDARPTLARLTAAGMILGVASNDTQDGIMASLGRHTGILDHFVFLAGCDSGHGAKPEPGMVHAFAAAAGIPPVAVAVVGDAVHDLEMGKRAGAGLKVGVCGGTSSAADLAPLADHVISRLSDLPAVLATARDQGNEYS
jgi:phosphoglycolate phosphatase